MKNSDHKIGENYDSVDGFVSKFYNTAKKIAIVGTLALSLIYCSSGSGDNNEGPCCEPPSENEYNQVVSGINKHINDNTDINDRFTYTATTVEVVQAGGVPLTEEALEAKLTQGQVANPSILSIISDAEFIIKATASGDNCIHYIPTNTQGSSVGTCDIYRAIYVKQDANDIRFNNAGIALFNTDDGLYFNEPVSGITELIDPSDGGSVSNFLASVTGLDDKANETPPLLPQVNISTGQGNTVPIGDGASGSDPEGDAVTYSVDKGDGSPIEESATLPISITYTIPGVHDSILRAIDSKGGITEILFRSTIL